MVSPAAQSKAQALNNKLESEARIALDDIEKKHLRKVARAAFSCSVSCYDKAGTGGTSDALDQCVQKCQMPHQQANAYVQQVRLQPIWLAMDLPTILLLRVCSHTTLSTFFF